MQFIPESSTPSLRLLHDAGALALLALTLVPVYLLLNQYWQSLILLMVFYGLLGFFCMRLGSTLRRAIRLLPAELPPWRHTDAMAPGLSHAFERQHRSVEAMQSVRTDPCYVQEVFKPRLRALIAYRLSGRPETSFDMLEGTQLAHLDTALAHFLQRQEVTTLWARYSQRQRRVHEALEMLRRVEAL